MVKCDNCGLSFEKKRDDKRENRTGYKNFCSLKCYFESRKNGACVDCGSVEIIKHNHKAYPKKICGECLEKRKKNKTLIRKKEWKKEWLKETKKICSKCGHKTKSRFDKFNSPYICGKCKIERKFNTLKIVFCKRCSNEMRVKYDSAKKICDSCNKKKINKSGLCKVCGTSLYLNKNKSSRNGLCDNCYYIRKRGYKDSEKYGDDKKELMRSIRLIEDLGKAFEQIKMGRNESCLKKENVDWLKVVQSRLGL